MKDTGVRDLSLLEVNASTSRLLNVRYATARHGGDPELLARPFFNNLELSRSLVVKHHLRRDELELFSDARASATKVILPIDQENLRAGARYLFVGQREWAALAVRDLGLPGPDCSDIQMLRHLDEMPSFDPFLLREQLRRRGREPAAVYFNVSTGDLTRMLDFATREIQPLVAVAGGESGSETLARKLLSNINDQALQPLRGVLQLDVQSFAEGVFCWKAFLYYKWKLIDLTPEIMAVNQQLGVLKPAGRGAPEVMDFISAARTNVRAAVQSGRRRLAETLRLYDIAYTGLIQNSDTIGFRDFLLDAPKRFIQLGEDLAVVEHMISFWRYRFPTAKSLTVSAEELVTVFRDFEIGLRIQRPSTAVTSSPNLHRPTPPTTRPRALPDRAQTPGPDAGRKAAGPPPRLHSPPRPAIQPASRARSSAG